MKDPEKARVRRKRYNERRKIAKYGPASRGVDMRGRHGNHATGDRNARWAGGRFVTSGGYVAVRVDPSHPHAWKHGSWPAGMAYAYEHDIVMMRTLVRPLAGWEVVHHINGDKTDNRASNLQLLTRHEHAVEHNAKRPRDSMGRFLPDGEDLRVQEFPR